MSETLSSSTFRLWRRFIISIIAITLVIATLLLTLQFTGSRRTGSTMTGTYFLDLAQRAAGEKFVATYLVRGNESPFIVTGKIVLASDPGLLPKNPPENSAGYSGAGEYFSYVFTRSDGSVVQWVQKGAYVSWCLKWPSVSGGKLGCTGPSPFEPSNGYAYQLLTQTNENVSVTDFWWTMSHTIKTSSRAFSRSSFDFRAYSTRYSFLQ